jgi:hypothetical protein
VNKIWSLLYSLKKFWFSLLHTRVFWTKIKPNQKKGKAIEPSHLSTYNSIGSGKWAYTAIHFPPVVRVDSKATRPMTLRYPVRFCLWEIRRRLVVWTVLIVSILSVVVIGTYNWLFWEAVNVSSNNVVEVDLQPPTDGGQELLNGVTSGSDGFLRRPALPLSCVTQSTAQYPDRYCAWGRNLKDCLELLSTHVNETSSWVLLGGPETASLAHYISIKWPSSLPSHQPQFNETSRRNSCQNLLYYGLPPPSKGWIPPDPSKGEGPVSYGLENPYCMDCKKCWNVLLEEASSSSVLPPPPSVASGNDSGPSWEQRRGIEYLVVEYARDVSIQTSITNTTQETASYYLSLQRPDVCVVSVGLWDAAIVPPMPQSVLVANIDRYIGLLQRVCGNVVWISIPAVVEDNSIPQKNCQIQEWNAAILTMLHGRGYYNVYVIDIWDESLQTDHVGYVFLTKKWYATLARLFIAVMSQSG